MKKILFVILLAAFAAGGCASGLSGVRAGEDAARLDKSRAAAAKANEAAAREASARAYQACLAAHEAARSVAARDAVARKAAKTPAEAIESGAWMKFYAPPPGCFPTEAERRASAQEELDARPVVLPSNIGTTMAETTAMDRGEMYAHPVNMAVAAKGVAAVIGYRDPATVAAHYEGLRRDAQEVAVVAEYRRVRFSDFVRPYPWYGYTPEYYGRYPYASGPVPLGIEVGIDFNWSPRGRAGTYPNHGGLGHHFRK